MKAATLYIPGFRKVVPLSSVLFLAGDHNYTTVHCKGGKAYLCATTLKKITAACPGFLRISKSHSINPDHLLRFDGKTMVLREGRRLSPSRRKQLYFKQTLSHVYVNPA